MPKTSVAEWDTTAANNTDINSITLAENQMYPRNVNNAFREMMAQVASASRRGADLATAGTLNLDSVDTAFLDLTGTTTVTAVTLTDTHSRRARAVGAFQLTASASLIVNGSASVNYTTTAGDLLFFEGYGSNVVRVWALPGGSAAPTFTSTTEILTGTDTTKTANANGIAALWEKGSDVASSGTISLGEGGFFHITGTTTITDIDFATAKDGRGAWLEFDGILTLTHHATTLNLPGAANITTAAGDRAYVIQDSSDNVHVMAYVRAAAAAASGVVAWVNFNGTGTPAIRASSNVSSITDNGTGDYTINFTSALADANYAWAGQASLAGGSEPSMYERTSTARTTSLIRVGLYKPGVGDLDPAIVNFIAVR